MDPLFDKRKKQAQELRAYADKISEISRELGSLQVQEDQEEEKNRHLKKFQEIRKRLNQRVSRLEQTYINIAVIGLEKQGKSSVINAWIKQELLPTAVERCTWATTTIVNDPNKHEAHIEFYSREEIDKIIAELKNDFGEIGKKINFPLSASDSEYYSELEHRNRNAAQELSRLSKGWDEIQTYLDQPPKELQAGDSGTLRRKLFPYVSLIDDQEGGHEQNMSYAVKNARVHIPFAEDEINFQISDLPGLNAPGNRAEDLTWNVVENSADIILWIKNAVANPSLVRDEENVWTKASQSDESIRLTDRLLVILNQADDRKIEHKRDCHKQAKKLFMERDVPENRIFFCSARAELKELGLATTFEWTDIRLTEAKENVCGYLNKSEPTTGFPEFREAVLHFIRHTLPRLEDEAFNHLKDDCQSHFGWLRKFVDEVMNLADFKANASPREKKRFDELWAPQSALALGTKGLTAALIRSLETETNKNLSDYQLQSDFQEKVVSAMDQLHEEIVSEITPDAFCNELSLGGAPGKVVSEIEGRFRERQRRRLKERIPKISDDVFRYTKEAAENLWRAVKESTDQAYPEASLSRIPNLPPELMGEGGFLKRIRSAINEENIRAGYSALLQAASYSPSHYFMVNDPGWNEKAGRIRQKIDHLRKIFQEEESASFLQMIQEKLGEKYQSSKIVSRLSREIRENAPRDKILKSIEDLTRDHLNEVARVIFDFVQPGQPRTEAPSNSGADHSEAQLMENDADRISRITEDIHAKIREVIDSIKVVLLDKDFGLVGFHSGIIENIRLILDDQIRDGEISDLAFKHRREIWPEEDVFRSTEFLQQQHQRVEKIKQNLTL